MGIGLGEVEIGQGRRVYVVVRGEFATVGKVAEVEEKPVVCIAIGIFCIV